MIKLVIEILTKETGRNKNDRRGLYKPPESGDNACK